MKKTIAFIMALSLSVFPLTYAPAEDINILSAEAASETEVINNTKSTAMEINVNDTITDNLASENDANWYKITLDKDSFTSITFEHESTGASGETWALYLYESDGVTKVRNIGYAGDSTLNISSNVGLPAGDYYIKVVDGYYRYSESNYNLTVNSSASDSWETENNGKISAADNIGVNTEYTGSILNNDDIDYYKFTIDDDGYLAINLQHDTIDSSSSYWKAIIYKEDGETVMMNADFVGSKPNVTSTATGLEAGTYYLKIISSSNQSSMDYIFNIKYTADPNFETELNNTMMTSDEIKLDTDYKGIISDSSDIDWYKFTVDKEGYLNLDFKHDTIDSTSSYWSAYIYEEDGTTLVNSMSFVGNKALTSSSSMALTKGNYYIKFTNCSYNTSNLEYTFNLAMTESTEWETEDNDTKSKANAVELNTVSNASLMNESDVDWFKFTLDEQSVMNLEFGHEMFENSNVYWDIYLYDADASTLLTSYSAKGDAETTKSYLIGLLAGEYYIKVSKDSYYYSGSDYTIKVNSTPTVEWETELNDTKTTADNIDFKKTYNGNIKDSSDADWYTFDVKSDSNVKFTLNTTPSGTNKYSDAFEFVIYNNAGTEVDSFTINQTADKGTVTSSLIKGTYYIKIVKGSAYTSNDYSFKAIDNIGDVDLDGEITSNDALSVLQMVTGLSEITDEKKAIADVDDDGEITSADALLLLQYIVGNIEEL